MKKMLIALFCAAMVLSVAACGEEAKSPETPVTDAPTTTTTTTTTTAADASTTTGEDVTTSVTESTAATTTEKEVSTTTTTTTKAPSTSTSTTVKTQNNDNAVNWDEFGDASTTSKPTKESETTTSKPTTTTTTATTVKPTTIDKISLPAVGTDVDGRGRIAVSFVELKKGVLTMKVRNNTDKQVQKWITEETDYVTYACYDVDGNPLKSEDEIFGYIYLGCLEAGEEVAIQVTLPEGTARVELTGSKIVYWTPWVK